MLLDLCLFVLFLSSPSFLSVSEVGLVPSEYPACESKAETKALIERFDNSIFTLYPPPPPYGQPCFNLDLWPNLSDSLVIPVDFDGSVVIMDEKGSLGANHAGVCMIVKLRTAFSLASRSREGTQPGCSYCITTARHQYPVAELRQ